MRKYITALFILIGYQAFSQSLSQKIEKAFSVFENDPQMRYGISSLTVLNAETGQTVFSKNEFVGLPSASTLKTVTSATAYYLLGKDFTWNTTLGYSGSISTDGTLHGNLVITGGGDPTLGSWRYSKTKTEVVLKDWADAVKNAGIKSITGQIIGDDRLFGTENVPVGWIWQDMGNYYGAGPNSLTWHENQYDLTLKPGSKVDEPVVIQKIEPEILGLKIINEVKTGKAGSGDNVYAYSAPYTDFVYLRGTYGIDLKKEVSGSVPDPALQATFELQNKLKSDGIVIQSQPSTARRLSALTMPFQKTDKIISVTTSPMLEQVVYLFNQKSINLYGEHMVKTLAWKQGKEPTTENGIEVIKDFWNKKLGLDKNELNIKDGSGLSPGTKITTHCMAVILQLVKKEAWFLNYYESLPIYNDMKMKSGSINDVLAYAGYQTSKNGTPLVFSFIINNYNGSSSAVKQKMYKVLNELK